MRYLLNVNSKAAAGRDDEFNTWYDNVHVHDVLKVPGFLACTRYVVDKPGEAPLYVAAYEVETDDPEALLKSLFAATPNMQLSDSIDTSAVSFTFLRPHGSRVVGG